MKLQIINKEYGNVLFSYSKWSQDFKLVFVMMDLLMFITLVLYIGIFRFLVAD